MNLVVARYHIPFHFLPAVALCSKGPEKFLASPPVRLALRSSPAKAAEL